jgi:small subunit ribosomal protein S17
MPKQELTGKVISAKMQKTIVVAVDRPTPHRKYKKASVTTKHFYAHDEECLAKEGFLVTIVEHRPMSKLKRWKLLSVIEQPDVV